MQKYSETFKFVVTFYDLKNKNYMCVVQFELFFDTPEVNHCALCQDMVLTFVCQIKI